jgi:tetratricopeptide (TPR) repeat protein
MKKVVVTSILIATVLMGGLLGYALLKGRRHNTKDFFESGKQYYEQKKYSEAVVQLLNAVQTDPKNREARYLLSFIYLSAGNLNAAAQQLNALLEYFPDDVEGNLRLGTIYLTAGRSDAKLFRQASEIAQKVLTKEPENVAALILSGNAAAGLQDYKASVEQFEKAVTIDPANTAAFVSLGTSEVLQKNYEAAEQALLKARQLNPKDKSALLSLGNYYRAAGQTEKAKAIFEEALSIYPSDRAIYLQTAGFYYQLGRLDEVERVLKNAQANTKGEDPSPSLLLADIYASKDRSADARKLLLDLKEKFPKNLAVSAAIAQNLLPDQPEKARVEIDQILKADANSAIGLILLGELQFNSRQFDAAEATFEKDPALKSPYPQPHFFLGNIALGKGQVDQAISHFEQSIAVNAGYVIARVALADVYLRKNDVAKSREEIRKVLQVRSGFVPARLLEVAVDMAEKNYADAEQKLNTLVKDQPQNPLVYRQLGLYYETRGRNVDAEKALSRSLELLPDSEDILRQLTMLDLRSKQADKAIQRINAVPDANKKAFHYELLGMAYSQAGKPQDSERSYKKALELEPGRSSSDAFLFSDYIKNGRTDDALKQLDEVLKKNPSNAQALAVKGQIYQSQEKIDDAKRTYQDALKVDPNLDIAANNLAYILAEEGRDLNSALGLAQIARKKQPESPSVADTLGWVYYKLGNQVLARDQLRFAVTKEPDNAVFQYHLGMIYKQTKEIPEAQAALKKATSSPKDFKEKSLAKEALKEIATLK